MMILRKGRTVETTILGTDTNAGAKDHESGRDEELGIEKHGEGTMWM
jgi:hypothetical protein